MNERRNKKGVRGANLIAKFLDVLQKTFRRKTPKIAKRTKGVTKGNRRFTIRKRVGTHTKY